MVELKVIGICLRLRGCLAIKSETGSVTLEASLIFPIFVCFFLFLILLVQIGLIDMNLQQSVAETTREVAAYSYPVMQLQMGLDELDSRLPAHSHIQRHRYQSGWQMDELEDWFFDLYDEQAKASFRTLHEWLDSDQVQEALQEWSTDLIKEKAEHQRHLDIDHLEVTQINWPFDRKEHPYLSITVEYRLSLPIPLISRELVIQKRGMERLWIGANLEEGAS